MLSWKIMASVMTFVASAVVAAPVANADLVSVRGFADGFADAPGPKGADLVAMLAKEKTGAMVVVGIAVIPPAMGKVTHDKQTIAIIRSRSSNAEKNLQPDAEDLRFAGLFKIPTFVVGTWTKPATLWEIDTRKSPVMFRSIEKSGMPGAWQSMTKKAMKSSN